MNRLSTWWRLDFLPGYLRLVAMAFVVFLVAFGVSFAGYGLGWRWLRVVGLGLGVLAVCIGFIGVLKRTLEIVALFFRKRP